MLEVVENLGDGLLMAWSAEASFVASVFGQDELSDEIKQMAQDAIQYDWTEAGYSAQMDALGVDYDIAHGLAHDISGGLGTTAGYIALSLIPGGQIVTATTGALSAAGSASEMAFNSGATYEEALVVSTVAGVAGAASGYGLEKIGNAASSASKITQVAGYTGLGAVTAMSEPVVNSTAQYLTYGKDAVDENGNPLYDNYWDYYVESGGLIQTVTAGVVGGSSIGIQGVKGYLSDTQPNGLKKSIEIAPRQKTKLKIGEVEVETNLTKDELLKFANDFYDLKPPITSLGDYPNYGVIENVSSIKLEDGKLTVDWVENQGAVHGTRKPTTIAAGTEIDRYGNPNGNFFGKMDVDADGNYIGVDYDKRSLPYAEGSQSYTKVKILKDINSNTLSDALTDLKKTDPDFFKEITIQMKKDGFSYIELPDGKIKIDVNEAKIAPAYGHNGGGTQYELPIRSESLKDLRLGFLSY